MTLISGYKFKEGAFLQSDVLLTSESMTNFPDVKVPTYTGSNYIPHTDRRVAGLTQKIFIFNEKLAIACAGDLAKIKSAIHCIKAFLLHRAKPTLNEIMENLINHIGEDVVEISLIFMSVNGNSVEMDCVNSKQIPASINVDLYVAGSGWARAKELFQQFLPHFDGVSPGDVVAHGVCTSLFHFAEYILKEFDNKEYSENLQDYFGGGFEVAAFFDGKIQKISHILYAYSEAYLDDESYLQIEPPNFILKSEYIDNNLLIRSAEIYLDKEKHHKIKNDRVSIIPSLDSDAEAKSLDNSECVNFAVADFVCYFVRYRFGENFIIIPYIRKYISHRDFLANGFTFLAVEGYLYTEFRDKFRKEICEHIMHFIKSIKR